MTHTCADCKLTLPLASFHTRPNGNCYSYCRPCMAVRNLRSRERAKPSRGIVYRRECPLNQAAAAWIRTS